MSYILSKLNELNSKLAYIKEYLIKLGPERRQTNLGFTKFNEAKLEFNNLENILSQVNELVEKSEISSNDITSVHAIVSEIKSIYSKITSLESALEYSDCSSMSVSTMADKEKFDLKTAIALLPVMTDQEHVTKSLIDAIELYSSMILENTHAQLINFVIKTRLSPSAKLRLKNNYSTVQSLLSDMNTHLIQKKSAVSIQYKLQNCRQGHRSIESFGSELEHLFVNLTLAQSDDDNTKFEVLRPINEKLAIKRFSDGLSNQKLSTIIAARNFNSLPEAIRTALDEQSMSTRQDEVMNVRQFRQNYNKFSRNPNFSSRNYNKYSNNYRNYSNNRYNFNSKYNTSGNTKLQGEQLVSRGAYAARGSTRGRARHGSCPRQPLRYQRVQYASHQESTSDNSDSRENVQHNNNSDINENADTNDFFRPF